MYLSFLPRTNIFPSCFCFGVAPAAVQQCSSVAWRDSPTGAHRLCESRAHTGLDGGCPLPEASCCLSSEQRTVSCERDKKNSLLQTFSCWTSKNTQRCFTSPMALSDRGPGSQRRLRTPLHRRVRGASKKFFCRKFICKVALVHFQLQDVFSSFEVAPQNTTI